MLVAKMHIRKPFALGSVLEMNLLEVALDYQIVVALPELDKTPDSKAQMVVTNQAW